jgi:hypothetical protein
MISTTYFNIAGVLLCICTSTALAQVEIKGTGTTSATQTFITRDAPGAATMTVSGCNPIITQNNITQNRRSGGSFPDIDYSNCIFPLVPTISSNIYDFIIRSTPSASGQYNSTAAGGTINP